MESRLLLDYGEKSASVIAQWDGDPKKKGDDQLPQVFSGAIDLTGDGRAEVILNRTANEVTNWEIYSSTVAAPNSWTLLFKTNYDGC